VDRDELIFKVLSGSNSIFLTWREVGSATQRLVRGFSWVLSLDLLMEKYWGVDSELNLQ